MRTHQPERLFAPLLSRRRFVQGMAGAGVLLTSRRAGCLAPVRYDRAVLTGPDFDLTIGEVAVNYTGRNRTATAVNGQVPARRAVSSTPAPAMPCTKRRRDSSGANNRSG